MKLWDAAQRIPPNVGHGAYFKRDENDEWMPCCALGYLITYAGGNADAIAMDVALLETFYGLSVQEREDLIFANDDSGDEYRQLAVLHAIARIVIRKLDRTSYKL